jgi:hypothetical protein
VTNRKDETDRPRDTAFTAVFALLATGVTCAIVLLAVPRPAPFELPVLMLDEARARAQIAADESLSAQKQSALSLDFYSALRAAGREELEPNEKRAYALEQRIIALKKRAVSELDAKGLAVVRAYATQRSMLALFAQLDDENEERELIGPQRSMFAAYGYISPEGSPLAPALTLRTMFKVRWNMIFLERPTRGLSPIELYAYEGFRALETDNMPTGIRVAALYELIRAGGGVRAERALAVLQAANGKAGPLIARVQNSEKEAAQIRLRNMALTVLSQSTAEPEP